MSYVYKVIGLVILIVVFLVIPERCEHKYWEQIRMIDKTMAIDLYVDNYYLSHGGVAFNDSLGLAVASLTRLDSNKFEDQSWYGISRPFRLLKKAHSDTILIIQKNPNRSRVYVFSEK